MHVNFVWEVSLGIGCTEVEVPNGKAVKCCESEQHTHASGRKGGGKGVCREKTFLEVTASTATCFPLFDSAIRGIVDAERPGEGENWGALRYF
jgi:hypothetical protein